MSLESGTILSQYKGAFLQAQGSLLQYQVDEHKADGLLDAYNTTIAQEFKDLRDQYENLQRQYTYMATHQRLDAEYGLGSKRRKRLYDFSFCAYYFLWYFYFHMSPLCSNVHFFPLFCSSFILSHYIIRWRYYDCYFLIIFLKPIWFVSLFVLIY